MSYLISCFVEKEYVKEHAPHALCWWCEKCKTTGILR